MKMKVVVILAILLLSVGIVMNIDTSGNDEDKGE